MVQQLKWYEDSDLAIYFDKMPVLQERYIAPWSNEDEINEIKEKPFICLNPLEVTLFDFRKNKEYSFKIEKDYTWDGATIPRLFWRLIGSKTDNSFLIPSLIHDKLCENHEYIDNDRYFATKIFERLLFVSKVPAFNRWLMFHSVDNFQKLHNWGK